MLEDPDAPSGVFHHWGVYDLPMTARQIDTDAAEHPHAIEQTLNDFGDRGYGPPCPPRGSGPHHYRFKLLALDVEKLPRAPANAVAIIKLTKGHVLGTAEVVTTYERE